MKISTFQIATPRRSPERRALRLRQRLIRAAQSARLFEQHELAHTIQAGRFAVTQLSRCYGSPRMRREARLTLRTALKAANRVGDRFHCSVCDAVAREEGWAL